MTAQPPPLDPLAPLLDLHGVARLLGIAADTFRRKRATLEAAGFPPPLPGFRTKWDPLAILAWRIKQWPAELRPAEPGAEPDYAALAREGLERVAGRLDGR